MYDSIRTEGAPSPTARLLLTLTIVELTLVTAYIHLTLGGLLFALNGLGYLALAALYGITAMTRPTLIQRFSWVPRVGLAGYTLVTIVAYLVIGPYFALGWIAKGVEVAIMALVAVDAIVTYGTVSGLALAALRSLGQRRQRRRSSPEPIRVE